MKFRKHRKERNMETKFILTISDYEMIEAFPYGLPRPEKSLTKISDALKYLLKVVEEIEGEK